MLVLVLGARVRVRVECPWQDSLPPSDLPAPPPISPCPGVFQDLLGEKYKWGILLNL